jgi:hypothetical protein
VASRTAIYTMAVLLFAGGVMAWFVIRRPPADSSKTALTPEAKSYVHNLKLSEVSMKATESYVKQMVTEIEGKLTNAGDRAVKRVEVYCVFYNSYGEVVLRERVPIVRTALQPGEMRAFRMPFDTIPGSWNNQMPQLVIALIDFT